MVVKYSFEELANVTIDIHAEVEAASLKVFKHIELGGKEHDTF